MTVFLIKPYLSFGLYAAISRKKKITELSINVQFKGNFSIWKVKHIHFSKYCIKFVLSSLKMWNPNSAQKDAQ